MIWFEDYPILIIDDELDQNTPEGKATREISTNLESREFRVVKAITGYQGKMSFIAQSNLGAVLLDWDLGSNPQDQFPEPVEIIKLIRDRNQKIPLFLMTDRLSINDIPLGVVENISGYIWKMEDTPEFIAGRIIQQVQGYLNQILPPFFKELLTYTREYKYSWHTPGHMGGIAFLKSSPGRIFYNFYGENAFRADLSVSVPELGSLLEHSGVVGEAEKKAAHIFNADRTLFVTNGTSTANKIVWQGLVTSDDLVLVDRNCHKSIMHAIIMTGAIPIYLKPSRNDYGIIGPIELSEFDEQEIKEKVKNSGLVPDNCNDLPKLAVITNSTYDGLCYHTGLIKQALQDVVPVIHFDEAWYGYANFHELYRQRFGMEDNDPGQEKSTVFATQSTHKVLAAFSQGSMIHVKSGNFKIDEQNLNESFMMHTSTSPQYSIIASLDVAAKMMEGQQGRYLIHQALEEAVLFRKKMVQIGEEICNQPGNWWFKVWQPEIKFNEQEPELENHVDHWVLKDKQEWHGFDKISRDYVMLDPIKVTILTPGIEKFNPLETEGIPACVVSRFLRTRGIVVEKTGHYSFLMLFTLGITKGKSGTLLAELFRFKKLYESNIPLKDVFPDLVEYYPHLYQTLGLKDLAQSIHECYQENKITGVMHQIFSTIPKPIIKPLSAYQQMIRGKVKKYCLDEISGRISAVMVVPYPPGIPVIMPGEEFPDQESPLVNYLKISQEFDRLFPGFENEMHGIDIVTVQDSPEYYISCIDNE